MPSKQRRGSTGHYQPLENYGVIGDLRTVALVGIDGSIDFMCFPEFDSPTIFAALLDHKRGGHFSLGPELAGSKPKQLYLPDSNILLSRFLYEEGVAEVSDFMPITSLGHAHALVRRAKTVRGEIPYTMICEPRFDYGRAGHRIERRKGEVLFISRGKDKSVLRLRSDIPLRVENGAVVARFKLRSGESASFVLEDGRGGTGSRSGRRDYVAEAFKETMNFWQQWIQKSHYRGRWREMVNRSALTLKLLTSARLGSMVAAPTFGLPEEIGGVRNWDYRYTWIRDASFTLYALMRLGYVAEATAFMNWIEARCKELKPGTPLQTMYGVDGRHDLEETILSDFQGYQGSRPVRIGNEAATQLQLGIYGELMDSVYIYNKFGELISYDFWRRLAQLIDWVCDNWNRPDEGIWEVRGGAHPFLYSRVMCWGALDRGLRLAQKRSFPAPLAKWQHVRTFSMCSFWNVECLARCGDLKQARFYFEKTLGYANHLGLYSEEIGLNGEQLGNFPQAFTHLGLISAAYYLDRALNQGA